VLLFWVTPIIYSVDMAPKRLQAVFKASPLAAFTIAYQDVLVSNRIPEGLVIWTLLGWTVAALLTGSAIFRAHSPSFAEEV
jgi:lipopolysaccharide transport system permease protein